MFNNKKFILQEDYPSLLSLSTRKMRIISINIYNLLSSHRNLAVGIGIQNFPEGLAVSLPLRGAGFSMWRAFWWVRLVSQLALMVSHLVVDLEIHMSGSSPYTLPGKAMVHFIGSQTFLWLGHLCDGAIDLSQTSARSKSVCLKCLAF